MLEWLLFAVGTAAAAPVDAAEPPAELLEFLADWDEAEAALIDAPATGATAHPAAEPTERQP